MPLFRSRGLLVVPAAALLIGLVVNNEGRPQPGGAPPIPKKLPPRNAKEVKSALTAINALSDKKSQGLRAEREAALRRLKSYRYLVGVPYEDLSLDDELNKYCDGAATINEKLGKLSHYPANPGLPEEFYKVAKKGAAESNLAQMSAGGLVQSVDLYMNDSDAKNVKSVGHRRWCVNPAMTRTGFGKSGKFSAMYAIDSGRKRIPDYDYIAFPPPGAMPVEYYAPGIAWSVSLNPSKFKAPASTIKPKVFAADGQLKKVGSALKLDIAHVHFDEGIGGVPGCLIFRPERLRLQPGGAFVVEIEGLVGRDGQPAPLTYVVEFVSLR